MLNEKVKAIVEAARPDGWVMEPEAKRLMGLYGIEMPPYVWIKTAADVASAARCLKFPLAAKVVSPAVVHKSDVGGVAVGIDTLEKLDETFARFSKIEGFSGMHVEPMARGVELIIGAMMDRQFGPVVLLGVGGTMVEIYRDTVVRMAPLAAGDVHAMVKCLKARALLEGYRGRPAVSIDRLSDFMVRFSEMVMDLEAEIASIDLNPVMASADGCAVADARIMLNRDSSA